MLKRNDGQVITQAIGDLIAPSLLCDVERYVGIFQEDVGVGSVRLGLSTRHADTQAEQTSGACQVRNACLGNVLTYVFGAGQRFLSGAIVEQDHELLPAISGHQRVRMDMRTRL